MNARQKAKRYKHKYNELLNRYQIISSKIDVLTFEHYYDRDFPMGMNESHMKEIVVSDIAHCLSRYVVDNFDKYVNYRAWFNPYVDKHYINARIAISRKES